MKKFLVAALAAVSAAALLAGTASALPPSGHDNGRWERRGDDHNGEAPRGRRGDNSAQRQRQPDASPPPVNNPRPANNNFTPAPPPNNSAQRRDQRAGGQGSGQRDNARAGERHSVDSGREWSGRRDVAPTAPRSGEFTGRRDGGRSAPPPGNTQWNGQRNGGTGQDLAGGRRDGDRNSGQGQGQWNGRRDGDRSSGQGQGQWNGRRDGDRSGGQGQGQWNGRRDGNRSGEQGQGQWNGRRDGDRGAQDARRNNERGRDNRGQRDWRTDARGRNWQSWNWRGDDHRYDPYRRSHRDFYSPRYRDWRAVRYGYYFDPGYARIVSGFYGYNYYWWSYTNWRRPYRDYRVGYYLPDWIYWEDVPWELYYRLPPAPYGCRYILVDRDILLISLETGIILDALLYY